jgi:hypothetical protein
MYTMLYVLYVCVCIYVYKCIELCVFIYAYIEHVVNV